MKLGRSQPPASQLSWFRRFCYGIGQGGSGIVFTLGTTFLMVYYTNVAHLNPAVAATVIAASKLLDGLSDLAMGYILDHTRSRFGKARPWLLRIALPTMLCLIATFSIPAGLSGAAQIVYAFVTYNLFSTVCYTVIGVSYTSLNSLITTSQYERGINSILGMTFYTVALLALNMTMLKLCTYFGQGELYSAGGWTATVALLAVVFGVCVMITFLFSRELTVGSAPESKRKTDGAGFLRVLKELVTNRYWVEYVVALLSITISNVIIMGSAVYYAQFILGDAYSYASLSTALYIAMFLGVIATSLFIKRIGKRNTVILGIVVLMLGTVLSGILPQTVGNATMTLAIRGFGVGFPSALGAAMLQDTLTYGKWKSGLDMVGMGNAASSFCMKIGGGLGTAIIGWALALGGFDAAQAVQGAGAKSAIMVTFIWLPLVFMAIALVCFIAYKLDREYSGYLADLNMGRYGPNAAAPEKTPASPAE